MRRWSSGACTRWTCSSKGLAQVETELASGAEANGYPNDIWTLQRVAEVIERTTQRGYGTSSDTSWAGVGVFEDESGVSLLPSVRATWAPRRHTPVLRHRFNWKRLSLAGALAYEPDVSDAHVVFELRPGAYNDETLIEFLSDLNEIEHRPVRLIWDGPPAQHSMRAGMASQRDWLSVEQLPGYTPDLNPLNQAGGNPKFQELANLCRDTIDEVADIAADGLDRIGTDAEVCFAFLYPAGLRL